jgi:hypothetical protein
LTGTEILAHANYHTEGDTIGDTEGLKYINECLLMDIGLDYGVYDSEDITVSTIDEWIALPTDLLEIFEIAKNGCTDPYYGKRYGTFFDGMFDIRSGYIRFPVTGVFTIHYFRVPDPIVGLGNTPEVHALLHYPIALYVACRYKKYDDEDSKDAARLATEYEFFKSKALEKLRKINPTTKAPVRVKARSYY